MGMVVPVTFNSNETADAESVIDQYPSRQVFMIEMANYANLTGQLCQLISVICETADSKFRRSSPNVKYNITTLRKKNCPTVTVSVDISNEIKFSQLQLSYFIGRNLQIFMLRNGFFSVQILISFKENLDEKNYYLIENSNLCVADIVIAQSDNLLAFRKIR